MDKHYSPDNYLGVAIVRFEDLQLKRASLSVIFLLATATSVSTATQYGEMIFCTNIRAIYYTSLPSRRSEVTGARKNGAREVDTRGQRETIFIGLSKGGLCSLPMMHWVKYIIKLFVTSSL